MPVVWLFILLLKERKNPTDPLSHFKSAGLHVHKAYFFSVSSLIWKYFLISCYISNHSLGHIRLFFNSHDFLIAYFKKSLLLFFWLHCIKFHVPFVYKLSIIIKQMICLSSSNLSQSWLIKDSLSFNMHRRRENENNQYHICCCVILTISLFILAWNTLYVDGVGSNLSFQIFKAKLKLVGLLV